MRGAKILLLLFLALDGYMQKELPNALTAGDKIYGVSKFWQEVNYNFVYLDMVNKASWDSAYRSTLQSALNTTNDYDYYRLLQRLCAFLKDGHTNVYLPPSMDSLVMTTMFGDYRLFLQNIDGKAIVVRVNAGKKEELPPGSEIIEVNGKPVREYMAENVTPYLSSSTDYVLQDLSVSYLLQGLEGQAFAIKVKRPDGKIILLRLVHKKTKEDAVYPAFVKRNLLDFQWHEDGIAYLALNAFDNRMIDTLFTNLLPELYKAKGLVIDLRYNGGGSTNIATAIFQYLTRDRRIEHARSCTRQHIAAYKAWGADLTAKDTANNEWRRKSFLFNRDAVYYSFDYAADSVDLDAPRIVVPTVILMGHGTASAAEDFLISASNQEHITTMGERSFGSTGQPYYFDLPGGGSARVCTKKDTYPDGKEFVGYGIKPDIEIKPALQDFLQGQDLVLKKALAFLRGRIKNK